MYPYPGAYPNPYPVPAMPITRTYESYSACQQDIVLLRQYGYQAVSSASERTTDGLILTLILIFGLLLLPFCIGLLVLCFLPAAFSTRYVVQYAYMGPVVMQPMPLVPQPTMPRPMLPMPQSASMSPAITRPLAPDRPAQPNARLSTGLARWQAELDALWSAFRVWPLWQQIAAGAGVAVVLLCASALGLVVVHALLAR
jgi:hypothetical protein